MNRQTKLGGKFTLPGRSLSLNRMGYGAMQLAGPGVWGLPPNIDEAVAVLRNAVAAGVNHIDTSDYYGPTVTNQLIKQVLYPYPKDLVIVTKVGYRRGQGNPGFRHFRVRSLSEAVQGNLRNLGLDALDVVNLRVGGNAGPTEGSIEEPMNVLAELKSRGLIRQGKADSAAKWPGSIQVRSFNAFRILCLQSRTMYGSGIRRVVLALEWSHYSCCNSSVSCRRDVYCPLHRSLL